MAVITISRQIASFGDEVASELSKKLQIAFINRKLLEEDLLKLGLKQETLKKYDEKKIGFWASLARDRDEYFDYLREAVFERTKDGNCVLVGRGGVSILKDVPGCFSVRLVASVPIRVSRLMNEFSMSEKKALALVNESDVNRQGFHKSFFDSDTDDAANYTMVLNTDSLTPELAASIISTACSKVISGVQESIGIERLHELLLAQKIVNRIVFDLNIPIHFLEASASSTEIILHGVADSSAVIDRVVSEARAMSGAKKVSSAISIVQDYKSYP